MNQLKTIANEMLPVYENESGEKLVSARELHKQLFSRQEFTNWIKRRIENYGFVEGEDFLTTLSKSTGGRPSTEYLLFLDIAKEIAMVENNEQGRVIRKYFIEVEKRSRVKQPQSIEDLIIMQANSVKELKQEVATTKQELITVKSRVDNWDKVNPNGNDQQKLNNMIRKYAADNGIAFPESWRHFRRLFNNAYKTNIKALMKNYQTKHGLKSITAPQYLSMIDRLDDGIRIADKMLNSQTFLTTR